MSLLRQAQHRSEPVGPQRRPFDAALWQTLLANPLLAPGMLALAAMIAIAATYYHLLLADN